MPAVDQDSRYFLANIKPVPAVVAEIESARLVVSLNNQLVLFVPLILGLIFAPLLLFPPPLLEAYVLDLVNTMFVVRKLVGIRLNYQNVLTFR